MNWTPRFIALSLAVLSAGLLLSAESNNKIPAPAPPVQVGQVNFSTSCSAEARPAIETGVALLHSFQYQQADQSFSDAAKRDSKCAMAYWGKAMSHYEQLWEFPSGKALKLGAQDIHRAQALGASTERERGYIAAAAAFYLADAKVSETQRVQAFSAALAGSHKQSPDDVNAAAFYALSLLALADQQEVDAQANRKAAIAILEPLCRGSCPLPDPRHGHRGICRAGPRSSSRLLENRAGFFACPAHAVAHFRAPGSVAGIHIVQHRRCRIRCQSYAGAPLRATLPIPRARLSELFLSAKRTRIQGSRAGERVG